MSQIKRKWIGNDQVGSTKILLDNATFVRVKDSQGDATNVIGLDVNDNIVLPKAPLITVVGTDNSAAITIGQVDTKLADYVTETELTTALGDYVTDAELTTALGDYATTASLGDYVTETELTTALGDYVTETELTTALGDYVTETELTTALGDYVTDTELTTALGDYATTASLGDYVTETELTTALGDYATTASLADYVTETELTTALGDYVTDTELTTALGDYVPNSSLAANNGVATLNAFGKLESSQVPQIAIVDTFVVADEAAMLALSTAEQGDVAVRSDLQKSFILTSNDPSVVGNWQELLSPTDTVQSVNGQVGAVQLDSDDVLEGSTNLYFTDQRAIDALETDLADKANTNLDNLVATSIPAGVKLESLSTSVTFATEFQLRTVDQSLSSLGSGSVRVISGNVVANTSGIRAGDVRMNVGDIYNANVAGNNATGFATVSGGNILSGSNGNTGNTSLLSGSIRKSFQYSGTPAGLTGAIVLQSSSTSPTATDITLTGDGVQTVQQLVDAWNLANPARVVVVISGPVSEVPDDTEAILIANNAHTGNTGWIQIFSGNILNPLAVGTTGRALLASGNQYGTGGTGVAALFSGFSAISSGGAATGDVVLYSGKSQSSNSGKVTIYSGQVIADTIGGSTINNLTGTGATGDIEIFSGRIDNTGSAQKTGDVRISSGSHAGSGISGDIFLTTGSTVDPLDRGIVSITSRHVDMNAAQVKDLADPTDDQDAATKAYVDDQVSTIASIAFGKLSVTLSAGDITNGYIDLAHLAIANSIVASVDRLMIHETDDYSLSVEGGVTRLTFLGDLVTPSESALEAGDKIRLTYAYNP